VELEKLHHCDLTKNPYPEYMDFIITEDGPLFTASLFLISFDYGIIMILLYEMTPIEILKKQTDMNLQVRLMSYLFERRKICQKKQNSSKTPSTA